MTATTRSFDPTALDDTLCMALELGEGRWKLGFIRGFGARHAPKAARNVRLENGPSSGGSTLRAEPPRAETDFPLVASPRFGAWSRDVARTSLVTRVA